MYENKLNLKELKELQDLADKQGLEPFKVQKNLSLRNDKLGMQLFIDVAVPTISKVGTRQDKKTGEEVATHSFTSAPEVSIEEMIRKMKYFRGREQVHEELTARYISVVARGRIGDAVRKFLSSNPSASAEACTKVAQEYADKGWNKSLSHPETTAQQKAVARKAKAIQETESDMGVTVSKDGTKEVRSEDLEKYLASLGIHVKK